MIGPNWSLVCRSGPGPLTPAARGAPVESWMVHINTFEDYWNHRINGTFWIWVEIRSTLFSMLMVKVDTTSEDRTCTLFTSHQCDLVSWSVPSSASQDYTNFSLDSNNSKTLPLMNCSSWVRGHEHKMLEFKDSNWLDVWQIYFK